MSESSKSQFIENLVSKWPSPLVAQTEVKNFSGGILCGRTLANLHSLDKRGDYRGPALPPKIRFGSRKVGYGTKDLATFLWDRCA